MFKLGKRVKRDVDHQKATLDSSLDLATSPSTGLQLHFGSSAPVLFLATGPTGSDDGVQIVALQPPG